MVLAAWYDGDVADGVFMRNARSLKDTRRLHAPDLLNVD